MTPCDICHKQGHAWYDCPDRAKMGPGWKPARLRPATRGSDLMPQGIKKSTVQPTVAAEVTTPDANTRGQTGSAGRRARGPSPASRKAVAKQVRQSGQEAPGELPVDTPERKPGRPREFADPKARRAEYMREWRARRQKVSNV